LFNVVPPAPKEAPNVGVSPAAGGALTPDQLAAFDHNALAPPPIHVSVPVAALEFKTPASRIKPAAWKQNRNATDFIWAM